MKVFVKRISIFTIILLLILVILDLLSMIGVTQKYFAILTGSYELLNNNGSDQIIPCIEQAREQDGTTVLITGDSVCSQMYSGLVECNKDITIIGANGGVTMAGQYIFIHEYLENHPDATDVYLIVLPVSLLRGYDTDLGYQYAVEPFVKTETLGLLNQDTKNLIKDVYGSFFTKKNVCMLLDKSGVNKKLYLNALADLDRGQKMSYRLELADTYIIKAYELCKERNVSFHLYSGPVSESMRSFTEGIKQDYETSKLEEIFPNYFDSILYYPDVETADGTHFSGDYANQMEYNKKISIALSGTELLEKLRLSY